MYGEIASVRGVVDLTPQEALGEAESFLVRQGYQVVQRTENAVIVQRQISSGDGEGESPNLTVAVTAEPPSGVRIQVRGNDQEGVREQQAAWLEWSESLPRRAEVPPQQAHEQPDTGTAGVPLPPAPQAETQDLPPPPQAPSTPTAIAPTASASPRGRSPWWWIVLGAGGCLVTVVLLVALVAGLAILGSGISETAGPSGSSGDESADSKPTFTKDNYGELIANPDAHRGQRVEIGGQVFQKLDESGGEITFQMFADPENSEWSTLVVAEDTEDLDLNTDDYVIVEGEVLGTAEGENYFGTELTAPEIQASEVRIVSAGQAIDPAQEVLIVNQTQSNQGFFVTLRKIEFGEESTRAHVTIRNDTGRGASFYTFDAKIQQGSNQIDYLDDFAYYEEEPQSDLRPGVETEGVLAFGRVDPNQPFTMVIPWTSNNWNLNTRPVTFQISP